MEQVVTRKKLIEVSLPLDAINAASAREKSIRHGHPSTLHLWWARRPLAAARAVLFAQLVDDPSGCPEEFRTEREQSHERQRLFALIEDLVKWENTTDEEVLEPAREEIRRSWRRTCEDNRDHPRASDLFDPDRLPAFHDPFAGGGSIPLEAQRLGLEAHASDLNPVAVLINKAMIEIPPMFSGQPPANPESRRGSGSTEADWKGAAGLAEDVRYYGRWMRDEAEKRIGHLYPKVEVTAEMAEERPDLEQYVGRELTVIAWIWARTVKSPNPAFADVDVPLAATFVLSRKPGREAYVEPVIEGRGYRFVVKTGSPPGEAGGGTKLSRGSFGCLMSGLPMSYEYIDKEANEYRMRSCMMAVVVEGDRGRVYLSPTTEYELVSQSAELHWKPELPSRGTWGSNAQGRRYGFKVFGDYFTNRQLVALTTFSDLVSEARERIRSDAVAAGLPDDAVPLREGGKGAMAYAEAVSVYLGFAVSKTADSSCTIARWQSTGDKVAGAFARQAIPMVWDFAEANIFSSSTQNWMGQINWVAKSVDFLPDRQIQGLATQADAAVLTQSVQPWARHPKSVVFSTDPPYYDNVGYADLSDFFYVWLRRSLRGIYPDLFATLAVPKSEELIASPYRHGDRKSAEAFFLNGMSLAVEQIGRSQHEGLPISIFYAFKQSERNGDRGVTSTGWETFLDAVFRSGLSIVGTWPVRTERAARSNAMNTNALASSIVLVCRTRPSDAEVTTRREFVDRLQAELPHALRQMQQGNIAPVDLAQAAIGPGMAVFTRYERVLDASGEPLSVGDALSLVNQTLDEVLAEQEGDFDADTRWAVAWFEQSGFDEGAYGVAETLSTAKNTSVDGMVSAGIVKSGGGRVRLMRPEELSADWDPERDTRRTVWESVHQLVRVHAQGGEEYAAGLLAKLGPDADAVRELAYRLYRICDQRNRSQDALGYNALVRSWGEIRDLASQLRTEETQVQMDLRNV